jgi:hypothetical protein
MIYIYMVLIGGTKREYVHPGYNMDTPFKQTGSIIKIIFAIQRISFDDPIVVVMIKWTIVAVQRDF